MPAPPHREQVPKGPVESHNDTLGPAVHVHLKVVPGSSRTCLAGIWGHRLRIKVAAPPEAGKANKALCKFLAKLLGIAPKQIDVVRGESSPQKTVSIRGVSVQHVTLTLLPDE